jgi:PHD/YefM family antitoxin component YafN of YafNO toxin-antitoxin module
MFELKEKYIVDANGNKVEVVIDYESFKHLMEEVEELEAIRAFDKAKSVNEEMIPLEEALKQVEKEI